ncbi:MAG: flagellar assembly protein FliH [Propionivibrio sp.]
MTGFIPKEKLTAYQRWEVAAFDEAEQAARAANAAAQAAPPPAPEAEPEPEPAEPPVVLPTAADIERMYTEAQQQGYMAGYDDGITAARTDAAAIDALLTSIKQSVGELDQSIAEQLLATAVEIANQVLRQSLQIKPELLMPVVREAITTLHPHGGHPVLFAHPRDAALIRAQLGDQLAHNNWRIIDDDRLTPGGCRVELGSSEVDATLETRWRRVIESIGINQDWLSGKP